MAKKDIDLATEAVPSPEEAQLAEELKAAGVLQDPESADLARAEVGVRAELAEAEAKASGANIVIGEPEVPPAAPKPPKPKIPKEIKQKFAAALQLADLDNLIVRQGPDLFWLQVMSRGLYELRPYWMCPQELREQAERL